MLLVHTSNITVHKKFMIVIRYMSSSNEAFESKGIRPRLGITGVGRNENLYIFQCRNENLYIFQCINENDRILLTRPLKCALCSRSLRIHCSFFRQNIVSSKRILKPAFAPMRASAVSILVPT
jgi:hypothetical protein